MECTNKPIPTELGRALTLKHSPFVLANHQEHAHASSGSHQEEQADLKSISSSPPHSVGNSTSLIDLIDAIPFNNLCMLNEWTSGPHQNMAFAAFTSY